MEIRDRRFVIFGGAGFIGSHLAALLSRQAVKGITVFDKRVTKQIITCGLETGKVEVVEGDVTHVDQVAAVMNGADGVFHLAALPINACAHMPRLCVDVNVLGTFNVLEAAQKAGVKKIVFSSASSVYGDTNELMDENQPLNARTLYGASKIAGEYFLRSFYEMYGVDYIVLRYMNVYGPCQEGGVVMSVLKRIQQCLPPIIYGDGSQSFDFVDVTDVARANISAMESEITDEIFNVGSGREVGVKEIVSLLLELTESPLKPVFEPTEKVLMQRRVGSNEKARRLLKFESQVDLREGLRRVVNSLGLSSGA